MAYICKNCGKLISNSEYKKLAKNNGKVIGLNPFEWFLIIFLFVSMVLAPIALLILLTSKKREPSNVCPYCHAKESLIPDNTPFAKKLIEENHINEEIDHVQSENRTMDRLKIIAVLILAIIIYLCIK